MITRGGAAGVGQATTNSVVICYSVILITNFFLTVILNNSSDMINNFLDWIL
jgi:phospholipid/cholesterol/gamma-HCH transport system permease protein